ncbi:ribonuclease H-like domain-containing protein [Tanacetum coccineum]
MGCRSCCERVKEGRRCGVEESIRRWKGGCHRSGSQVAYLLIYVDDIILTASSPDLLQHIIASLHNEFDMTDLGVLNYFLGISVDRTSTVDTESKLRTKGVPVQDPTLYHSLAGGLQYLTFTRPDYFGFQLYVSATTSLVAYTDADWAGCLSTRRSTSGYCVFLGDNLFSWSAKRQHTLSRSSAESEYHGVANVVAETAWLRNLLSELHSPLSTATLVYCDNVSTIYMSANPVQHQRTKHLEIDIHFVCDMVTAGHVRVLHVPSCYQYADIFTKGLSSTLFENFRSSLSFRPPPAPTAGAY